MATLDSPHLRHLLRAELDRRRALAGLAGAAALGLTGRRRAAAGEAPPYVRPYDLARAALRPGDVPGEENLETAPSGNRSFEGLSGAFESTALSQEDFEALEQAGALQELVAGHVAHLFGPGQVAPTYTTEVFQFASVTAARAAFDGLADLAGAELDEITPPDERNRFFRRIFEEDDDLHDVAVVFFRRMEVVVAITCRMEIFDDDDDDGPTDGEVIADLTAMSEAVGERVTEIVGDYEGIGANLPTPAEFSGRAGSLVPTGRGWRAETYTYLDGMRVVLAQEPTAGFPSIDDADAGIDEALCRQEEIHTYEGKKVVLGIQARRFAAAEDVAAFLARALAVREGGSEVAVEAIAPPAAPAGAPFLPGALIPEWTANRFTYKERDLYGVTAWAANDRDLIGVQVAGVPTGGAESALTEALGRWVWIAIGLYELVRNLGGLEEQEVEARWRSLYDLSPELCEGLVPLDFLE